jgi:hypothetical protein
VHGLSGDTGHRSGSLDVPAARKEGEAQQSSRTIVSGLRVAMCCCCCGCGQRAGHCHGCLNLPAVQEQRQTGASRSWSDVYGVALYDSRDSAVQVTWQIAEHTFHGRPRRPRKYSSKTERPHQAARADADDAPYTTCWHGDALHYITLHYITLHAPLNQEW